MAHAQLDHMGLFDGVYGFASMNQAAVSWADLQKKMKDRSIGEYNEARVATPHMNPKQLDITTDSSWSAQVIAAITAGCKNILAAELEKITKEVIEAENARKRMTKEALAAFGIQPTQKAITTYLNELKQPAERVKTTVGQYVVAPKEEINFFAEVSSYPELAIEIAAYMKPAELISLYAISKEFHALIDAHMAHTMKLCAKTQAIGSYFAFHPELYEGVCIPDPAADPNDGAARLVPGLKWLQQIVYREKVVRDILALMARQGHRMPKDMSFTLKKMWALMDIGTNDGRKQFISSSFFKARDFYNMQMFFIKLDMRFNDPIDGPSSEALKEMMLGQKSLTTLCELLKRKITDMEIIRMAIRYDLAASPAFPGVSLWNIPPTEFAVGHLEGWGRGTAHLLRPDELIITESTRRQLHLESHIMEMLLWGYVDPFTGENTPPTADEMYMSDDGESRSDLERMMDAAKMRRRRRCRTKQQCQNPT